MYMRLLKALKRNQVDFFLFLKILFIQLHTSLRMKEKLVNILN